MLKFDFYMKRQTHIADIDGTSGVVDDGINALAHACIHLRQTCS